MANQLDAIFSALGDPTRRAVLERLTDEPAAVSDLHGPHNMALPTFLRHLKVLEQAGLVRTHKTGRVRMVHIEADPLAQAETWLQQQRSLWNGRLDRLDALVQQEKDVKT
ncbi:metalloregulator ArsR/SmtB family transcription factor [Actibacterium sp. 188UL27-1]|uniref:ArsR/SmtB family transcription factor n=1 Tax=Actibacterium sp. 188UL27-1 TaxID=2786961 RepID=UPI00195E0144|nr:metalloregulator ArsR/SmtB family transcription factor [Actibacterium sp. 188UL27-1]MBM7066639.1 helix-turn-helix transcriptional regulator [Actibacterium sp. 188UL27-1]